MHITYLQEVSPSNFNMLMYEFCIHFVNHIFTSTTFSSTEKKIEKNLIAENCAMQMEKNFLVSLINSHVINIKRNQKYKLFLLNYFLLRTIYVI